MKQKMVVTNVRMPIEDWLQAKAVAGDLGMSINEYLNTVARSDVTERTLGIQRKNVSKKHVLEEIERIARMPNKPIGELSEEDKVIYDT